MLIIVGHEPGARRRMQMAGPAQRSLTLWPACSPSRRATLSIESSDSFVSSTAAPIASGWREPSSRARLSPAVDQRLFTEHRNQDLSH